MWNLLQFEVPIITAFSMFNSYVEPIAIGSSIITAFSMFDPYMEPITIGSPSLPFSMFDSHVELIINLELEVPSSWHFPYLIHM